MRNIRPFVGKSPRIHPSAWVDPTALVIGDVVIAAEASLWPMAVVRGDVHRIRIGRAVNIQDACVLHVSHDSRFEPGGHPLVVHDRVTVGHQATLHGCEIGANSLIGIGARVLDGARLEPRTLLGAGALVPPGKVLESGFLWLGAPVRRARALSDHELEYLDYAAAHYVRLARHHGEEKPTG